MRKNRFIAALVAILLSSISQSSAGQSPASILTHPPISMDGINEEHERFSGGMDPDWVTLGPKLGSHPEYGTYPTKTGVNYEIALHAPVLAPMDAEFVGFNNRNSDARNGMDGTLQVPFDDLELCFESKSADWPGAFFCFYHLKNSPLLLGINKNKACSNSKMWPGPLRAEGRLFYAENDGVEKRSKNSKACEGLLGKKVKRGSVIAYAGTVGDHSQAPIRVKVRDVTLNPTVMKGDQYLHWVQSDSFFYWKCFSSTAKFEPGVMAYPFECGGYKVSKAQRSLKFKYSK